MQRSSSAAMAATAPSSSSASLLRATTENTQEMAAEMDHLNPDPRTAALASLQREYRNMEVLRRAYAEETELMLKRQNHSIEKMRRDNDNLRNEIAVIIRHKSRPMSNFQQDIIQQLQDQGDKYLSDIDQERNKIATIDEQTRLLRSKSEHQRKMMGGINAAKESNFILAKQTRILESRLEKALVKFNHAVAENRTLREEIDHLRQERCVFDNVYKNMDRNLHEKKLEIETIIATTNASYEMRDQYQSQLAAMEQSNSQEGNEFESQMMEMHRLLEEDFKLPSINDILIQQTHNTSATITTTHTEDSKLKSQLSSSAKSLSSSQAVLTSTLSFNTNFEEAFIKIKAATGISDVDSLISLFSKNEERNYSLHAFVNEQALEIAKIQVEIDALNKEEAGLLAGELNASVEGSSSSDRLSEISQLTTSLDIMTDKYEDECQSSNRCIGVCRKAIDALYASLSSSLTTKSEQVSNMDGIINEVNMTAYLSLIENMSDTVLKDYVSIRGWILQQVKHDDDDGDGREAKVTSHSGVGPSMPVTSEINIMAPNLNDFDEDDGEDKKVDGESSRMSVRPLSRQELHARTVSRLSHH